LGRWDIARSAWRDAGIDVPGGEGPVDYPCGRAPIRLNPNGDAEVVWSERVDPARAIVQSIPLPESAFRFGDLVLNDGAGTGFRKLEEREVPVFNCLGLLRASRFSTWVLEVELEETDPGRQDAVDLLEELALAHELAAEDWTMSIQMLCKACSEGKPYAGHEHPREPVGGHRRLAIASPDQDQVRALLDDWRSRATHVSVLELELAFHAWTIHRSLRRLRRSGAAASRRRARSVLAPRAAALPWAT
jgi:hypothetical protein